MIVVISEPRCEPIYLADARRWLGLTDDNDTDQDPEIWAILRALREYAEKRTGRRFVDQELELNLDCWPDWIVELPVAPIVSIDYVRYLDTNGELQTFYDGTVSPTIGADQVWLDIKSQPGRLQPAYGGRWPILRGGDFNAVQIGFTAGYGTGGSPEDLSVIPKQLQLWLRYRLAGHFEQREPIVIGDRGQVNQVPESNLDALLSGLTLGRRVS